MRDGMTWWRLIGLCAAVAAACGSAACRGPTPPARVAPAASAQNPAAGLGNLLGPGKPVAAAGRASAEAVLDAYMEAARLHRYEAMLDFFEPASRAAEANKANGVSHTLARKELTILSHHCIGASGDSWQDEDGRTRESGSFAFAVETEEAGRRETLELGFSLVELDGAWFMTFAQISGPDVSSLF